MLRKEIILILSIMLLTSCASIQSTFRESEIPDQLWDDLSKDLVELQVMVISLNKKLELENAKVNVKAEPWEYPVDRSLEIGSVSLAIKKMTDVKLPTRTTKKGYLGVKIYKVEGEIYTEQSIKRPLYLVVDPTINPPNKFRYIKAKNMMIGFDPSFNKVEKNELTDFLNLDHMLYESYKTITTAVKKLQEKHKRSPIYIDGFTVQIGIPYSVDINFKFK